MRKVKAIVQCKLNKQGLLQAGSIIEVEDRKAEQLVAGGRFELVKSKKKKPTAEPVAIETNNTEEVGQ